MADPVGRQGVENAFGVKTLMQHGLGARQGAARKYRKAANMEKGQASQPAVVPVPAA